MSSPGHPDPGLGPVPPKTGPVPSKVQVLPTGPKAQAILTFHAAKPLAQQNPKLTTKKMRGKGVKTLRNEAKHSAAAKSGSAFFSRYLSSGTGTSAAAKSGEVQAPENSSSDEESGMVASPVVRSPAVGASSLIPDGDGAEGEAAPPIRPGGASASDVQPDSATPSSSVPIRKKRIDWSVEQKALVVADAISSNLSSRAAAEKWSG